MSPVDFEDAAGSASSNRGGRERFAHRVTRWVVGSPGSVWAVLIIALLGVALGGVSIVMSRRVLASPGQVMDHTQVARVPFSVDDPVATDTARRLARERAPRVYISDEAVISALSADIRALPALAASVATYEEFPDAERKRFSLSGAGWTAAREYWFDTQRGTQWQRYCDALTALLRSRPVVDAATFAQQSRTIADRIELVGNASAQPDASRVNAASSDLLSVDDPLLKARLGPLAVQAGFTGDTLLAVAARLAYQPVPTFRAEPDLSRTRQDEAAAAVPTTLAVFGAGDVLYRRGERITSEVLARAEREQQEYSAQAPLHQRIAADAGTGVTMLLVALAAGAYLGTFAPVIVGRPRRLAAVCGLFAGALVVSCVCALVEAKLIAAALVVPPVFLAAVLVVAYERRTALAVGSLLALATALALRQPLVGAVPALTGVGVMVWQLRELRQRGTLIRAGLISGGLTAGVQMLVGALRLPLTEASAAQSTTEAISVGIGVLLTGFVVLGLLPTIEKAFKVVTALSLIELRDPSHPLLRRLQQRAPGTYSHSMNVATMAETAARAIGADGLLAYVGALYHDVGKMNRPEFFIENQTGINRHDKLPPAMSTLMIVSHVPDGLQLAREHALPRPLHHFIESHHGTTMVEYFFRRAMKQYDASCAEGTTRAAPCPVEGEYRYPGPKPRTKEVACIMICDAAESTARTMTDPSALKIDQMVRSLADKRLADGQFDECELTMAELTSIVQSVSNALASIYHQRVVYPEGPRTLPGAAAVPVGKPVGTTGA